jgi:hypothetical protein
VDAHVGGSVRWARNSDPDIKAGSAPDRIDASGAKISRGIHKPSSDGRKANRPTNHAYDAEWGYDGLLLNAISPQIAEWVFPFVATAKAEVIVMSFVFMAFLLGLSAYTSPAVPRALFIPSVVQALPAIVRLAQIDLRVLRLLVREFEVW